MELSNFFSSLDTTVKAASFGITVLAAAAWLIWNPRINSTSIELNKLRKHFEESGQAGRDAIKEAVQKSEDINIKSLLAEVQSGLFELPGDFGVKTYSLRSYEDVWTARALLARKVNLALYESAPNILIGIGLLCTFFFLAIALADVLPAFRGNTSPEDIKRAIEGLLQNAAGKFLTSISGMFCSLVWTYASKRSLVRLEDDIDELCAAMRRHVEDTGGESAITSQIALLGEILNENRAQVGQLKRFETDFAVAIGKALGSQMQPAFDQLTQSITNALNALSEKVGSMNEDALKTMLQDFQSAIREHSGQEMESFKQALIDIANQIKDAANKLEGAGGAAGDAIQSGGQAFTDALSGGAGDLRNAAGLLERAMTSAKEAVQDMDQTIERAAAEGQQGISNLQEILARLANTAQQVDDLIIHIQGVSDDFKSAATATANATGKLESVIDAQNSIVSSVSETASSLGSSLASANNEFKSSAKAMTDTTKEMTAGVQNYSQQVAELHSRLDENLAKAIGSLNSTISELVDGLDDFLDEINKRRV